jgi:signal peptidase II
LKPVGSILVVPGILSLTYVENSGAAFGILQGQRWILVGFTALVLAGAAVLLMTGRIKNKGDRLFVSLILGGGIGNLVDRMRQGYVVDYLDVNALFPYPMFNFADCCVVIGAILMAAWTIKEDVMEKRKKNSLATVPNDLKDAGSSGEGS